MDAVLWLAEHEGAVVEWLPVDAAGRVHPETLEAAIAADPGSVALVTVMWANNEVGTVQPVAELAAVASAYGVPFHSDAVQAFGAAPGRLRGQRAGRDDRDRAQDRRPARRRGCWSSAAAGRPGARSCTAAARSATSAPAPSTPRRSSGLAAAAEVAVKRQAERAERHGRAA